MDLDTGKSADKYPLHIFRHCILFHNKLPIFPYVEGRLAGDLKLETGCPEAGLWEDTLALSYGLSDSPIEVVSSDFNMVGRLRPLHIVGKESLRPNEPWAGTSH